MSTVLTFFAPGEKSRGTRQQITSWEKFFSVLSAPRIVLLDLPGDPQAARAVIKSAKNSRLTAWSPALFEGGTCDRAGCSGREHRKLVHVKQVAALVLDFDNVKPGTSGDAEEMMDPPTTLDEAVAVWRGHFVHGHTSFRNTSDWPKFRLAIPYRRPVTPVEHDRISQWAHLRHAAAGQTVDPTGRNADRLWYLGCYDGPAFRAITEVGTLLDPEAILAQIDEDEVAAANAAADMDLSEPLPFTSLAAAVGTHAYGMAALEREAQSLVSASPGTGHRTLTRASFRIGQLVAGDALPASVAVPALARAIAGWDVDQAHYQRTLHQCFAAGMKHPRSAPRYVQSVRSSSTPDIAVNNHVDAPWPEPHALREHQAALMMFPSEALPPWLREWVVAVSVATQTPADLAALLSLASIAVCVQRNHRVRVREGWYETPNIYTAVVLPPGSRKSAVFRAATGPLHAWEREKAETLKAEIASKSAEAAAAKDRLRSAEQEAARSEDTSAHDAMLDAARALKNAEDAIPIYPRLITSDATQEALARLLERQREAIGVMDAEGCGPIALMLGRYAKDGALAVDLYLRGHAGDAMSVDRIGREPITLDRPKITLAVTTQPEMMRQLGDRPELRGLGLMARVLWSVPATSMGTRMARPPHVPSQVSQQYASVLNRLLRDSDVPQEIRISAEGDDLLAALHDELEPQLAAGGALAMLADWVSKLVGCCARISALLHAAEHPDAPTAYEVSADVVRRAIKIGRYLLVHAQAALAPIITPPTGAQAEFIIDWLLGQKVSKISRRDLWHAHRGRFRRVEDIEPAIDCLVERGWIRVVEGERTSAKGPPPGPVVVVSPRADRRRLTPTHAPAQLSSIDAEGTPSSTTNRTAVHVQAESASSHARSTTETTSSNDGAVHAVSVEQVAIIARTSSFHELAAFADTLGTESPPEVHDAVAQALFDMV